MQAQRGNILFLILLAIVLFVALNYAVMQGMVVKEDTKLAEDKANLAASQMIQTASLIQNTFNRLVTTGNCTPEQISFNATGNGFTAVNAPADKHCHVFDPAGGGLSWTKFNPDWLTDQTTNSGLWFTRDNKFVGVGDAFLPEGVLFVRYIKPEICAAVNAKMGIGANFKDSNVDFSRYSGTFATTGLVTVGDQAQGVDLRNQLMGCVHDTTEGVYHFFNVFLPR